MQLSGNIPRFSSEQTWFQRNKSDGVIGVDYRAWRSAGFSQKAGRGYQPPTGAGWELAWSINWLMDSRGACCKPVPSSASTIRSTDSGQTIFEAWISPPAFNHASRASASLFRQRFVTFLGQQRDINTDRFGQPRDHVAIAAVITMTAQHQPVAGVRISRTTHTGMRLRQREASAHRV